MALPRTVRITFAVTPSHLARAMALDARDKAPYPEYSGEDRFGAPEDPALADHVRGMTKRLALAALRDCLRWYGDGDLSWPDDYPRQAYRAALEMVNGWDEAKGAQR